jgi:hypothetical protein
MSSYKQIEDWIIVAACERGMILSNRDESEIRFWTRIHCTLFSLGCVAFLMSIAFRDPYLAAVGVMLCGPPFGACLAMGLMYIDRN